MLARFVPGTLFSTGRKVWRLTEKTTGGSGATFERLVTEKQATPAAFPHEIGDTDRLVLPPRAMPDARRYHGHVQFEGGAVWTMYVVDTVPILCHGRTSSASRMVRTFQIQADTVLTITTD